MKEKLKLPWKVGHDGPSRPIILTSDVALMLSLEAFNNGKWGSFDDEEVFSEFVVNAVNRCNESQTRDKSKLPDLYIDTWSVSGTPRYEEAGRLIKLVDSLKQQRCIEHPQSKHHYEWAGLMRCEQCEEEMKRQAIEDFMNKYYEKPKYAVGVSVLLAKGNKVLLAERIGGKAHGFLSTPGGRVEYDEDLFTCARREFNEETGAVLTDILEIISFRKHYRFGEHYFMFYVKAQDYQGEIQNQMPDKSKDWKWWSISDIPLTKCTEPEEILKQLV